MPEPRSERSWEQLYNARREVRYPDGVGSSHGGFSIRTLTDIIHASIIGTNTCIHFLQPRHLWLLSNSDLLSVCTDSSFYNPYCHFQDIGWSFFFIATLITLAILAGLSSLRSSFQAKQVGLPPRLRSRAIHKLNIELRISNPMSPTSTAISTVLFNPPKTHNANTHLPPLSNLLLLSIEKPVNLYKNPV